MLESVFLLFILFQNIISRFLPSIFSYWDELACIIFLIIYFAKSNGRIRKSESYYFLAILSVIVLGLIGNLVFRYQLSISAIGRDILGTVKFFVVFISLYRHRLMDKLTKRLVDLIPLIKGFCLIVFCLGVVSIFKDIGMNQEEVRGFLYPYMFIYSHPTYLTTGLICILCILNAADRLSKVDDIIILSTIVLAMRTKGVAFIAVYVFLKYGSHWVKKLQIIYWPIIGIIVFFVARSKLLLYTSFSNSPRESLYRGAFELVKKCFPIGSGFATFASHISGKYLSKVYNFIYIAGMRGGGDAEFIDLGDAGLAYYIGQFGVIGIILFAYLFYKTFRMSILNLDQKSWWPVLYMWILVLISIPTESILVNNGFEIAFILIIVHKLCYICKTSDQKKYVGNDATF
ncbi:hypothetical protein DW708_04695 [Ruminococcus sp. AM27-11LB]|uniref:hypothetical protein n=1 Tax=Mediterraneibacter TaxID=2316020 RepID=UPI000E4EC8A9|nr:MULTISPECIES: hypothetical protein [Mediterraneibacter]RGH94317.1 hypothetical protein DW719_05145 [Ruminococcus sp. AM27-27]RGH96846.1 hypothetical protein DW708_04695 [Ruminococcus sp. AM27-11LB]